MIKYGVGQAVYQVLEIKGLKNVVVFVRTRYEGGH